MDMNYAVKLSGDIISHMYGMNIEVRFLLIYYMMCCLSV